ncbi:MAG: TonB family protein [Algicola sp.]|nr:TonB family protein [Algicola sp.]
MQKWLLSSTFAVGVSFLLFVFMANLIGKPTRGPATPNDRPIIEFGLTKAKPDIHKVRSKIEPKPDKAPPPKRQTVEISDNTPTVTTTVKFDPTMISPGRTIGVGKPGLIDTGLDKPGQRVKNRDASPIVQIKPLYPIDAARKGIEGWVKLSFSIDKTGSVTNIEVLDSSPRRTFDRSAIKALKGWRYQAKFVNGAPVIQDNLQVQLDFSMDQ